MTTEVWTSTRGRISEATRIILQEALEEENKKDTPSFGSEDLEEIHRSGTEAGLLGIYNFPGSVYATDGSNDRGVMGAGFFKLDEHRGGCCQLGRGEEGNSSDRAELGAACLALEDSKRQQNSQNCNPPIGLSLLPLLLPKMDRRGEIPLYARKPGRRHYERHSTTPTRKNRPRSSHNFHQDKGSSWRPFERTSRQIGR